MKKPPLVPTLLLLLSLLTAACTEKDVVVDQVGGSSLSDPLMLANLKDGSKVELIFSAEEASIEVQKKSEDDADFKGLTLISPPDNKYLDEAVVLGKIYAYRARTFKDGKTSDWTAEISVSLPAANEPPPAKPAAPMVVAQSDKEFSTTLAVPSADVTSRKLFVNEQGSTVVQSAEIPLNVMTYAVKAPGFTIVADKFYEFRLRHYKGTIASDPSDLVTVKSLAAAPPPTAPMSAVMSEISVGVNNTAVVKWTHDGMNLGTPGFRVEQCMSLNDCNNNVFSVNFTVAPAIRTASFSIASIQNNGTFGARIVALGTPNAAPSNKLTLVRVISMSAPGTPTLNSVQLGNNTATAAWTPSAMGDPATAFNIMFCVNAVCSGPVTGFMQVGTAGPAAVSYSHNLMTVTPPLAEDDLIGYAIIAVNSTGASAPSAIKTVVYNAAPVPKKPTLNSAMKINSSVGRIAFTLAADGAPATMVKVFRALLAAGSVCDATTPVGSFSPVATIGPQTNPYDDSISGIPTGTVICYYIKAGNGNGDSKKSDDHFGFTK